ncbi:phosphate acetyltransferase [Collinsella sp. zg1085]|uniref:phosphate acyltransferase n=1 Tax=Collinsella sp. zg1085 TaxID=2844380 RepID=UPI001C0D6BCC|nr:phosphate acyltransferase [Collinsella sp. zg1085]QWT17182.1 phosphate acetyltransferase [Collinsella sp. zg1085]
MDTLIEQLIAEAQQAPKKRVALPECEAENTLLAARKIADLGIAIPVLVSPADVVRATAASAGVDVSDLELIDTTDEAAADALAASFMEAAPRLLSAKGSRRKIKDPMHYALMLEEMGKVDASFCGHTNTTGDVLMAASTMLGLAEGVDVPSIVALVTTPHLEGPEGNLIAFTDCGLNPEPTAAELASIAIAAADSVQAMMGWTPRVAFLSFSSVGSGAGASVDRVQEAVQLVHERRPDIFADGEFQLDTALDSAVAAKKLNRASEVAGKANVLVFPDLNAANIAVKMIQRFAGGSAYGHTLSGFKRPVADSSRGATVDEIVGDIAMLVLAAR